MRSITEDGKWAPKSRKVYDLDENGERIFQKVDKSGRKQYKNHKEDYNDWNKKERVEEWRAAWAACCNERLAERDRIDHRSYKRQGIEQEPTIHEGYTARKIAAEGKPSERVRINEEIRERNSILKQLAEQLHSIEQQLAELIREKGSAAINAGKQRIADLLARRSRTVDSDVRGTADTDRGLTGGDRAAAPSATDQLIRQAEIERRAAIRSAGLAENESGEQTLTGESVPTGTAIERGRAALTRSAALRRTGESELDKSETDTTSAAADRAKRDAERERQAAEASRRAEEERRRREEERRIAEETERERRESIKRKGHIGR